MNDIRKWLATVLLVGSCICSSVAVAIDWPQEVSANEGTIVVYQPQPEKLDGNTLSGRAAMSLEINGRDDAIFGTFWFSARIDTDQDEGIAQIRGLRVTNVRWPESRDAEEQRFTAIVEAAMPDNGFEISLERLAASLESAEVVQKSLEDLNNDPPAMIFRQSLAVLLMYDGEPRFGDVEDSPYERVLNTPFAVAREKSGGDLYLYSGKFWYEASDPMGPWQPTTTPPDDLQRMLESAASDEPQPDLPPEIVVATEPTELIVTQGEPDWQSLAGGELLYVQNTETAWLRELSTGNMYVLLSGRWFRSKTEEGPWTFVRGDELPQSFASIPPASDIGGVRTSVAGTEEAEDAVLDAQIPQTAAIKRDEASLSVDYDGNPNFERIEGTSVSYAVNTAAQVLQIEGRYYAVDNGVWYTSASATGPWAVADTIPEDEIEKIPPSSPAYNTTHVHVYESTPEIVYVGYTPGYLWSYPYYGVPVYGTGWYYPPYWGGFYYPRPPTWGFHVGYNPWTGWNFGMSWSNGFMSVGISWGAGYPGWGCCGGWYGGGYRGPTFINTGDINIGNNVNIGNRTEIGNRIDNDRVNARRDNLYNRPENRARNADRATARADLKQARPAANRANDVYADRNGNVARRSGNEWQTRQNGSWAQDRATTNTRPSTNLSRPQGIDRSSLNRSHQSRQHGMNREMRRPQMGGRRRR